jgi:hypothetical protein
LEGWAKARDRWKPVCTERSDGRPEGPANAPRPARSALTQPAPPRGCEIDRQGPTTAGRRRQVWRSRRLDTPNSQGSAPETAAEAKTRVKGRQPRRDPCSPRAPEGPSAASRPAGYRPPRGTVANLARRAAGPKTQSAAAVDRPAASIPGSQSPHDSRQRDPIDQTGEKWPGLPPAAFRRTSSSPAPQAKDDPRGGARLAPAP